MATVTRKTFRTVAEVIATLPRQYDRQNLARAIGAQLNTLNPNFDWQRWNKACAIDRPDDPSCIFCVDAEHDHVPGRILRAFSTRAKADAYISGLRKQFGHTLEFADVHELELDAENE